MFLQNLFGEARLPVTRFSMVVGNGSDDDFIRSDKEGNVIREYRTIDSTITACPFSPK